MPDDSPASAADQIELLKQVIDGRDRRLDALRRERNEILIPRINELEQLLRQTEDALNKSNQGMRAILAAFNDLTDAVTTAASDAGDTGST